MRTRILSLVLVECALFAGCTSSFTDSETTGSLSEDLRRSSFNVRSPTNGAAISGTTNFTGQAGSTWVTIAAYDAAHGNAKISGDVAPVNGTYSLPVDTTKLADGAAKVLVMARSAGRMSAEVAVNVTVNNGASVVDAFDVQTPANGSVVSGTAAFTGRVGSSWVNVAAYDANNGYAKIGADVTPANGEYSVSVDTTKLGNGAARVAVIAFSVPAGQIGGTRREIDLDLTVDNSTTTPGGTSGIVFGVNGHDGRNDYSLSQAEARFQLLDARNLRTYRFDVGAGDTGVVDTLVPLARKYNIALRPMLYPTSQSAAYSFTKRYANDIKIWEIGNEQDGDRAGAQTRINAMVATYRGVMQASDELGASLKTSINIMACNSNDPSSRCAGDTSGDVWFLDLANQSGFAFDYITFHYYPRYFEPGYWMDLYLGQMRIAATKYKTKIFVNETNCGEIYDGNTDGGSPGDKGCYDSFNQLLTEIRSNYSDIVQEVNAYQLLDEPTDVSGIESHFGLMYDLSRAKPNLDLLTQFAK